MKQPVTASKPMSFMRTGGITTLIAASVLAVSGCGSSSPAASPTQATSVSISVAPIINASPLYIAQQKGYFKDEGLNVTLTPATNVAAAFPALASGNVDIVYAALQGFLLAASNGQDMKLITQVSSSAPNTIAIVTKDPKIKSAKDLAGKKIATPSMIGCNLIAAPVLKADGADAGSVNFVEMPYASQGAALQQGTIDGACTVEPFITTLANQLGTYVVVDALSGPNSNIALDGVFAMNSYVKTNPGTIAKLTRAIQKASTLAQSDPQIVRDIATTFTPMTPTIAAKVSLPAFVSSSDPARIDPVIAQLVDAGAVKSGVLASKNLIAGQ